MVDRAPSDLAPPTPARPSGERFPCFDAIRALACFAIILIHAMGKTGDLNVEGTLADSVARLEVALPVFFVVSAFLIYRPFVLSHFGDRPEPATGNYLWRRSLRLFPALWLVNTIVILTTNFAMGGWRGFVSYYGLLWIYQPAYQLSPSQPAWTVATEATWYLLAPVIAIVMLKVGGNLQRRLRAQLIGIAVLFVISIVYQVWVLRSPQLDREMYLHWLPGWLDVVAMGMLLAVVSAWVRVRRIPAPLGLDSRRAPVIAWSLAFAIYLFLVFGLPLPMNRFDYTSSELLFTHVINGLVAMLILLPGVFGRQDEGGLRRALQTPSLVWLGALTYGMYLWHEYWQLKVQEWFDIPTTPDLGNVVVILVVSVPLTIAISAASWYLVERPALSLKSWRVGVRRG